jgi:hypothetical protein
MIREIVSPSEATIVKVRPVLAGEALRQKCWSWSYDIHGTIVFRLNSDRNPRPGTLAWMLRGMDAQHTGGNVARERGFPSSLGGGEIVCSPQGEPSHDRVRKRGDASADRRAHGDRDYRQ